MDFYGFSCCCTYIHRMCHAARCGGIVRVLGVGKGAVGGCAARARNRISLGIVFVKYHLLL